MPFNKPKELSKEQKKSFEILREQNNKVIEESKKILGEYEKAISPLDKEMDSFWDLMNQMEKAHSHYPLGHYAHYYYKNLEEPTTESFITEFGQKNPNFGPLSASEKRRIEGTLPDYDKYDDIITEKIKVIVDLVTKSISSNTPIIRIAGISQKYKELTELDKNWRYPKKLSQNEYDVNGSIASYDINLSIQIPYHRQLMITYDILYKTANILKLKLNELINLLESINTYIPFAELIPSEKLPHTVIHVEAKASNESVSVGDKNVFEGDATLGKGAKSEKK